MGLVAAAVIVHIACLLVFTAHPSVSLERIMNFLAACILAMGMERLVSVVCNAWLEAVRIKEATKVKMAQLLSVSR